LLEDEIESLMKKYGKEIWGVVMTAGALQSPKSYLLVAGEGEVFYTTDLFYSNEKHRP
jgi:hypothetical protein